jgi:transcriptional regulator with XRE-family HTH domain
MSSRISPPLRQVRLGAALRELRVARGLKLDDVAELLRCSRGKVSNVENGNSLVTPGYVRDALTLYGADEATRRRCLQLITDARTQPWWKPYNRVMGDYVVYETEARVIRYWQGQVVPGLLQTLDYARVIITADRPWEEDDVVQLRARARIARQWVITNEADSLVVDAIVSEDALHRPVGGAAVMAEQLAHLLEVGGWPNVAVRVVPRSVGAHAGLTCSFVLFSMRDMPTVLYREGGIDEIVDIGVGVAEDYERRFEHLADVALTPEASTDLIYSIRKEFVQRADRGMAKG